MEIFDDIFAASNILETCKSNKTILEFNRSFELKGANDLNFSTLFQNIDGNKSNFDSFALHISKISHKFSVIGLAETNIDPDSKELYALDD